MAAIHGRDARIQSCNFHSLGKNPNLCACGASGPVNHSQGELAMAIETIRTLVPAPVPMPRGALWAAAAAAWIWRAVQRIARRRPARHLSSPARRRAQLRAQPCGL